MGTECVALVKDVSFSKVEHNVKEALAETLLGSKSYWNLNQLFPDYK